MIQLIGAIEFWDKRYAEGVHNCEQECSFFNTFSTLEKIKT